MVASPCKECGSNVDQKEVDIYFEITDSGLVGVFSMCQFELGRDLLNLVWWMRN